MVNVTEDAAQVGQMLLNAMQNTLGMGPEAAVAQAQAETGVSDDTVQHADMGQVFDYMCAQPGLAPEVQSYLSQAQSNYSNYGNVSQGGSSYSGGGSSGYSGGGSGGGASNAQIVQQVTQNYNYQEVNDNHIDILGNVDGTIDIDQNNTDVHDIGDGAAVNTGDGNQNAATGDHSSVAQSEGDGNAVSNTGNGAVTSGDETDLDHSAVGDGNTILDNQDGSYLDNQGGDYDNHSVGGDGATLDNQGGSIDDHSASDGSTSLDNHGGTVGDSSLGFGEGDVHNETGAASSQGGDAQSDSTNLNLLSNDQHGTGDVNEASHHSASDDGGQLVHETVVPELHTSDPSSEQHESSHDSLASDDHYAPQTEAGDSADDHTISTDHDILHH